MMETDRLIERLAEASGSVRPLARPWRRTAIWLAVAAAYVALVVLVMTPRSDLAEKFVDARFMVELLSALATGIGAGYAAFATTIPGYDRRVVLLPVLPLSIWLMSLGQGCLSSFAQTGSFGPGFKIDLFCFPAIVLVGIIPAVAIVIMLRRGAPLVPYLTAALGGLAAAGIGSFGLRLFHTQDASLMILVWQFGTVMVLTCLAGAVGRRFFNWPAVLRGTRRIAGQS
ncbi:NrsF family protein [Pseudorhodoplanes sp.]|uniref:NrsF family protein n=1 Tax=Pseudorhodoplanes sp. TaxID=1934341 RepID=UPI003D0AFD44